jgi:hypothetical protein
MSTKKFKDWNVNEAIDWDSDPEIKSEFNEIPMIKKWEAHRTKQRGYGNSYTISIIKGFRSQGKSSSLRAMFNLPRIFINKVAELEKSTECHIVPDVISDRIIIIMTLDETLKPYTSDNDVIRKMSERGDMEIHVSFNTDHIGDLRKIFSSTVDFIMDDLRDATYIFNKDIRRFPKLLKIMKDQVDETYQKLLDDLIKGDLDEIKDGYIFDDDTVMVMMARAIDEDPSLSDDINSFPEEARNIWFKNLARYGEDPKVGPGLSKTIASLKRIETALKFI